MASTAVSRPRPAVGGFELYSWVFMRVSGLLLVFLALGHLAIMHIINSVEAINYAFVATRWGSLLWRSYDWLLLILALLHGFNGLRIVVEDYIHSNGWRVLSLTIVYLLTFLFLVLGSLVIFTFQPAGARG